MLTSVRPCLLLPALSAASPDPETGRQDASLGLFDDLVLDANQGDVFASESCLSHLDVARMLETLADLLCRQADTDLPAAPQDKRGHRKGYDAFRPTPTSSATSSSRSDVSPQSGITRFFRKARCAHSGQYG